MSTGADGGTRTLTGFPPRDFKSLASTIPPRPRAGVLASAARAPKAPVRRGCCAPGLRPPRRRGREWRRRARRAAVLGTWDLGLGACGSPLALRLPNLCSLRPHHLAPQGFPVLSARVRHPAVALEELVGDLEHGDEHAALRAPGRVPAASRTPDEFAGADLDPGIRALLSTSEPSST